MSMRISAGRAAVEFGSRAGDLKKDWMSVYAFKAGAAVVSQMPNNQPEYLPVTRRYLANPNSSNTT